MRAAATPSGRLGERLTALGLDFPRGTAQPRPARFVLATAVALGGSLLACLVLVVIAERLVPSTRGYDHFGFADWGKLTIIGVLGACLAWPVVAWCSTHGRRVLLVLAIAVTVASFAPDIWIGLQGQPPAGVATLAVMHVALLLVTYPALVLIAPQPTDRTRRMRRVA